MRPEKAAMAAELKSKLSDASFVILADYKGLNVVKIAELRRRLRGVNAQLQVIKNRVFAHVAKELGYKGFDQPAAGPSAMVFGKGDVVATAKILKDFIKENEKPVIKTGALQGEALTAADITQLASLPSREQLLAQVVGTLAAPMTQLVGVLQQKTATIVYVLKAIEEQKGKAG
jgi:large subunit ribosomal protein L10